MLFFRIVIAAIIISWVSGAEGALIFEDNFNRTNSSDVGNGWSEIEFETADVAVRNNVLSLRDSRSAADTVDAGATRSFSLTGYEHIVLDFQWEPLGNSDPEDFFYVRWDFNDDNWNSIYSANLGGVGITTVSLNLPDTVSNAASFRLQFFTDVSEDGSGDDEGVDLDNIVLRGDLIDANQNGGVVPEPGTLLIWLLGGMSAATVHYVWPRRRSG